MTGSTRPAGRSVGAQICVVLVLSLMVVAHAAARANAATNNIFTVSGTTEGLSATAARLPPPSSASRAGWR